MPKQKTFDDKDLTNMARGFDAPPEKQHLERIRQLAQEIQHEAERELEQERKQERDMEGRNR